MKIRPASDHLLTQCLPLSVFPHQRKHNQTPAEILVEAREQHNTVRLFVVDNELPQVIGMASYFHNTHRGYGYWISQFFIDWRFQGRGLGREAFGLLLDEIKQKADHRIIVSVDRENAPAVAFYKKSGFMWMADEKYPDEQILVLQI